MKKIKYLLLLVAVISSGVAIYLFFKANQLVKPNSIQDAIDMYRMSKYSGIFGLICLGVYFWQERKRGN